MACRTVQRGSASVEFAGVVSVVAALLAATAAWLTAEVRAPRHPPPLVEAVAAPVQRTGEIGFVLDPAVGVQPWPLPAPAGRTSGPRAVLWFGRQHRRIFLDNGDAFAWAFAQNVARTTGEEVMAVLRDPAGEVIDVVAVGATVLVDPRDPAAFTHVGGQVRDVREYIVGVYTEDDPRASARRVGGDLGGLTAEIVIGRAKALAKRRAREILRERAERGRGQHPRPREDRP